jgi:hypothetical protein
MLQVTEQHHAEYCKRHSFDHFVVHQPITDGYYDRVKILQTLLDKYDLLVYMDADAFIAKDINLRDVPINADEIGVCHYETPEHHYNTGVVYVRPGERVKDFIDEWWSGFPGYDSWHDQRVFNDIVNECVVTIPDEWNSCHINPVDDPIVKAYHGKYPSYEAKLEALKRGGYESHYGV